MSEPLNFRSAFNGFNREDVVHYIEYLNSNHENQLKQLQADLAAVQRDNLIPSDDNRDDIVADMQEQFNQQEAILTALNAEKDDLIAKCSQLEAVLAVLTTENKALTEKAAQLEAVPAALMAENKALADKVAKLEAVPAALTAENKALTEKAAQLEAVPAALMAENKALTDKVSQLEAQLATITAEKGAAPNARPLMSTYVEEELAAYRRAERVERLANERASAIYRKLRVTLQDTASKTDHAVTNLDSITGQFSALRNSLADSKTYLDQSLCSLEDICPKQCDE